MGTSYWDVYFYLVNCSNGIISCGPNRYSYYSMYGGWYFYFAHGKVKRQGAIFHIYSRLGQLRYEALEHELMTIINEKNIDSSLTYEEVIARSIVLHVEENQSNLDRLLMKSTITLNQRLKLDRDF